MFHAKWSVTATSTITAPGMKSRLTEMCGTRIPSAPVGLPIATDTGVGWDLGVGPGLIIRLGDSRPTTMAAGFMAEAAGAGHLVRSTAGRFMVLRSSDSSAELMLGLVLD